MPVFAVLLVITLLSTPAGPTHGTSVNGSGATFPAPLYAAWIERYHQLTETRIRYTPVGSGEGVRQLLAGEVEFGASDTLVAADEALAGEPLVHIPTCIGAVVLTYNLPDVPEIRLTPQLIADIFSGRITHWDDVPLLRANAGTGLPNLPITVVHRHDDSGTTDLFSSFLSTASRQWRSSIGAGRTLDWPVGYGADGNDGVARMVGRSRGGIGYVELTFAVQQGLPLARVQNRSGAYILPSVQSASAAASQPDRDGCRSVILDSPAPEAYPIAAFTWIVVPRELNRADHPSSEDRARALARFLWWAVHGGQEMNEALLYGALPAHTRECAQQSLLALTWDGEAVLP